MWKGETCKEYKQEREKKKKDEKIENSKNASNRKYEMARHGRNITKRKRIRADERREDWK